MVETDIQQDSIGSRRSTSHGTIFDLIGRAQFLKKANFEWKRVNIEGKFGYY